MSFDLNDPAVQAAVADLAQKMAATQLAEMRSNMTAWAAHTAEEQRTRERDAQHQVEELAALLAKTQMALEDACIVSFP